MTDVDTQPQAESGDDLRATITAAFEAANAQDDEDLGPSEPTPGEDTPAPTTKAERARDEHGRFVAKEADAPAKQVSDQAIEQAVEAPIAPINPPRSWPAERHALFAQLPRATQDWILERESQVEKGFTQKSQLAARYEKQWQPVEQELESKYRHYFERHEITPAEATRRLFEAQRRMDENPLEAIQHIAHTYKVDLAKLAAQPYVPQAPQSPTLPPELQEVRQFMAEHKARQQHEYVQSLESEVSRFTQAKDASGAPMYPHVQRLEEAMAPLVQLYRQTQPDWSHHQVLEKAYKLALHDNPEIAAEEARKAEAQRLEQAAAKAKAAKRAGASVPGGGPGGGAVSVNPGDLRATISAAWRGEI